MKVREFKEAIKDLADDTELVIETVQSYVIKPVTTEEE